MACNECTHNDVVSSNNHRFKAHKTIFGWAISGKRPPASDQETTTVSMKASAKEDSHYTLEESQAKGSIKDNVERDSDRRYKVKNSSRDPTPELANQVRMTACRQTHLRIHNSLKFFFASGRT